MYLYCSKEETMPYLCSRNFLTVLKTDIKGLIANSLRLFQIFIMEKDLIILYIAIIVPVLPTPPLKIMINLFKLVLKRRI